MVKVLDASALIVYLEKEPGYEKIKSLLVEAVSNEDRLMMSTINWGEVFYITVKQYGLDKAEGIQHIIETFPIEFVPADITVVKQAALYKSLKKLPYVDSFAAALAKLYHGELLTSDKEFKLVEDEIRITWI